MKGMRKISRGKGFAGVVSYGFTGEIEGPRELEGRVVGGNMSSNNMEGLINEFNSVAALRKDIEKPVWHNSLRLPKGEKISDQEWNNIGASYMKKMGFSKHHPYVSILHDDEAGQHIHIIASRVALDSKIFLGKNENLHSTQVIYSLEKEFGLQPSEKLVPLDADGKIVMPAKRQATKSEVEKALKSDQEPVRYQLQKLVDKALETPATATQFVERLQAGGVDVRVNIASTGRLNGFSFGLDNVYFGGQKLGADYKLSSLIKRGLTYEQDVEGAFLRQFVGKAEIGGIDSGAPSVIAADGSNSNFEPGKNGDREHRNIDVGSIPSPGDKSPVSGRITGQDLQRSDRQGIDQGESVTDRYSGGGEVNREQLAQTTGSSEQRASGSGDARRTAERNSGSVSQGNKNNHGPGSSVIDQSHRSPVSAAAIDPDTGVGPLKTGDKVADELAANMHYGQIAVMRKTLADNKKFWDQFWSNMATEQRKREIEKRNSESELRKSISQNHVAMLSEISGIIGKTKDRYHKDVLHQLKGLRVSEFEVRVVDNNIDAGSRKKVVPRNYKIDDFSKSGTIKYLRYLNLGGQDVYIRPAHPEKSGLVLIDDLNISQIAALESMGLKPAVLVETSEQNFQAWLRINDDGFGRDEHAAITKLINEKVGGDPASADQEHFGRLVSFTNRKPNRILADGNPPYVNLKTYSGHKAPAGEDVLQLARQIVAEQRRVAHEASQAKSIMRAAATEMALPERAPGELISAGWLRSAWERIERLAGHGAATSASEIDFRCAIELRNQNVGISEAIGLFDELPIRIRKGNNAENYAIRTVTRAYALVDLRIEGRETKGVDLTAEARLRYPHVFEPVGPVKAPQVQATLKTDNSIFAQLKAEEARKAIAALERSIDKE